jgi:hypothetical protein
MNVMPSNVPRTRALAARMPARPRDPRTMPTRSMLGRGTLTQVMPLVARYRISVVCLS